MAGTGRIMIHRGYRVYFKIFTTVRRLVHSSALTQPSVSIDTPPLSNRIDVTCFWSQATRIFLRPGTTSTSLIRTSTGQVRSSLVRPKQATVPRTHTCGFALPLGRGAHAQATSMKYTKILTVGEWGTKTTAGISLIEPVRVISGHSQWSIV
jgi:hypothetical protein